MADNVPLKLFDWLVAIDPANEFVLEALPPKPAKFLIMPVGPISAPIVSVFPDELETALLEENVSLQSNRQNITNFFSSPI